jgi:hypothetical protein
VFGAKHVGRPVRTRRASAVDELPGSGQRLLQLADALPVLGPNLLTHSVDTLLPSPGGSGAPPLGIGPGGKVTPVGVTRPVGPPGVRGAAAVVVVGEMWGILPAGWLATPRETISTDPVTATPRETISTNLISATAGESVGASLVAAAGRVGRDQGGYSPARLGDDRDAAGEVGQPGEWDQPTADLLHRKLKTRGARVNCGLGHGVIMAVPYDIFGYRMIHQY